MLALIYMEQSSSRSHPPTPPYATISMQSQRLLLNAGLQIIRCFGEEKKKEPGKAKGVGAK